MTLLRSSPSLILSFALTFFIPTRVYSQHIDPKAKPPSITVIGEAVVTVEPDQAEIDIGVVTQSLTAIEAANENAARLSHVIAELKKLVGAQGEIKTAGYS